MEDLSKYNQEGSTLRKAQMRMLEILKIVDSIFSKHHIDYYLDGGTLLGAVRHGGFIPWDDDIDISVRREDFSRIKRVLQKELPNNLVFQDRFTDWNLPVLIAKVRDKNSYYYEEECTNRLKEKGLFIDIIPMEKIPSWSWKQKLDYWYGHCVRGIHNYSSFQDKIISYLLFPFAWSIVALTRCINYLIPSPQLADVYGWKPTGFYMKYDVFPIKRIQFEDFQACVPNNPDAVLKALFGNYMQIPPEEKRKVHAANIQFWDK